MAPAGEAHVSPTTKHMNADLPKNQKLEALYSDPDGTVQKSEALIAEFMRLPREVPRRDLVVTSSHAPPTESMSVLQLGARDNGDTSGYRDH